MNILEVKNLKKSFGGITAVNNITFSIKEGETFGIIGPNGAGKTTLFNLITGIYTPENGKIIFKGKDITNTSMHKLPHIGIARTFQNLRLFNNLTVLENLKPSVLCKNPYNIFHAIFRTSKFSKAETYAENKAKELIEFFGLNEKMNFSAGSLSYGEQRKLELARALLTEPSLILIDEPGAGMNPKEISELASMIKTIKERFSVTIAIIEHQMNLIMNISDRIMVMDFGEEIMTGTPQEVKKDKRVIEAYLGEELD